MGKYQGEIGVAQTYCALERGKEVFIKKMQQKCVHLRRRYRPSPLHHGDDPQLDYVYALPS
jgi:hypothetical protein